MRFSFLAFIPLVCFVFGVYGDAESQMSDVSEDFIDQSASLAKYIHHLGDTLPNPYSGLSATVIDEAMKYIGTPYRWGGKTPAGFDCAGFVRYVYSRFGLTLSASAPSQSHEGTRLKREEISPGDLVFYAGRKGSKAIGHVGLVTEVGEKGFKFVHAASDGVRISSSDEPYYRSRYICACRVIDKIVISD